MPCKISDEKNVCTGEPPIREKGASEIGTTVTAFYYEFLLTLSSVLQKITQFLIMYRWNEMECFGSSSAT